MTRSERLALVDHDDRGLPVVRQCQLLRVARSTLYYRPAPVSADDLAVMRRMDELHLAWPFYGSRRMAAVLRREGWAVNRKRAKRLMRVMVRPDTVAAIADDLGKDTPRRFYKALVVRFVPFIGWTLFVTLLLATIYYNRDTTAPVLR